jgi:hypothetical protein
LVKYWCRVSRRCTCSGDVHHCDSRNDIGRAKEHSYERPSELTSFRILYIGANIAGWDSLRYCRTDMSTVLGVVVATCFVLWN